MCVLEGPLDDETQEVSLEVDSTEDDLETARVTRAVDLFKEDTLEFSEYRNHNRMELTVKRGWDQYLSEAQEVQSPVPVITTAAAGVAVTVGPGHPVTAGFFRSKTCYINIRTCGSSGSDCASGLE